MISLLAQYAYKPFVNPIPLPDHWNLLLIPLALGIAVIYKSIRCNEMRKVPIESIKTALFILAGLFACQYALIVWYKVMN